MTNEVTNEKTAVASRRVVITGLGAVSALGPDVPSLLAGVVEGRCGIRPVTLFDTSPFRTHTGGELLGFDAGAHFSRREQRRLSRADMAGLVAAAEALGGARAGSGPICDPDRVGVILGGGVGGLFDSEAYYRTVLGRGWKSVPATRALGHFPCATADRIAERWGFGGLRTTVVTACSSSTLAIGQAFDAIRTGAVEMAVTGGSDTLSRLTYSGFNSLRSVDPDVCRPFDAGRKGLSLGEGAAILVLEPLDVALDRGAPIHGEVLGCGMSSDAHHMTAPHPQGEGAALAMERAISQAGLVPGQVDYINAHGTGTPHNDLAETRAIHRTFGENGKSIPVSSTKSMLGHCLGSAGAMEALVTILALRDRFIPPTANLEQPDPECDLAHVPLVSRPGTPEVGISNSFAFGGNNGCLVLRRYHVL